FGDKFPGASVGNDKEAQEKLVITSVYLLFGFGDKFPGASVGNDKEAQEKLVITSVYLLFGMALLAMCFNLAQEEVVNKVSWLANKFRSREDDEYD
uniref:Ion_trans_2 domain-containing protein n=1 Tax=Ascaris lumbricoides TaxID=6252 RepID=A0A0M3I9U2_ASCLU